MSDCNIKMTEHYENIEYDTVHDRVSVFFHTDFCQYPHQWLLLSLSCHVF